MKYLRITVDKYLHFQNSTCIFWNKTFSEILRNLFYYWLDSFERSRQTYLSIVQHLIVVELNEEGIYSTPTQDSRQTKLGNTPSTTRGTHTYDTPHARLTHGTQQAVLVQQ